jgi:hypothetical protein
LRKGAAPECGQVGSLICQAALNQPSRTSVGRVP